MRQRRRSPFILLLFGVVATLLAPAAPTAAAEDAAVVVAAGDIGDCTTTGDEATAVLLDEIPGTVAHSATSPIRPVRSRFRRLLRADLGSPPVAHPAPAGTTSTRRPRPRRRISTTSERRRAAREGLVQLRPRGVACRRAQFELRVRRRMRSVVGPGHVAQGGPRGERRRPRPGVLPSPALQLRPARQRGRGADPLGGALRGGRRARAQWARPPLRALRPAGPMGTRRRPVRDPRVRRGHRRHGAAAEDPERAEQRGLLGNPWGAQADASGGWLRLGVRADRRKDVHGRRHRVDPRPAAVAHPPGLHRHRRHVGRPGPLHPELRARDDARRRRRHRQRHGCPRVRQGQGQRHDGDHRSGRIAPVGDRQEQGWADGRPHDDELDAERDDVEDSSAGNGSSRYRTWALLRQAAGSSST